MEIPNSLRRQLNVQEMEVINKPLRKGRRLDTDILEQGRDLIPVGAGDEAALFLQKQEGFENDLDAQQVASVGYMVVGKTKEGVELADLYIENLKQRLGEALYNSAGGYNDLGQYEEAYSRGIQAIELRPKDALSHVNFFTTLIRMEDWEALAEAIEKMKLVYPEWSSDEELAAYLKDDLDMKVIRQDPKFLSLVEEILQ